MPPVYDQKPWRRKFDDPTKPPASAPQRHYYPNTLQDLVDIVQGAEGMSGEKPEVRASGSHWAFSDAAVARGFAVETQDPEGSPPAPGPLRLNRRLYSVIPPCLSQEARRFFEGQNPVGFDPVNPPDESKIYLFHVEAGTRIYELYSWLDEGDDARPESLAGQLPKYKGPWAMATLGGAGGQTIVGAISTGTHGGDIHHPPIADAVQALHLIGPDGQQYWVERPLPNGEQLVDDDKLQHAYPGIRIWRDADDLPAVLVAVGRMGIIYSVVLRVIRQYALEQITVKSDWSTVRGWINNVSGPIFVNNRYLEIRLNPNAEPNGSLGALITPFFPPGVEHTCYVMTRVMKGVDAAGTPPYGRAQRSGANTGNAPPVNGDSFLETICASEEPIKTAIVNLIDLLIDAIEDALDDAGLGFLGDIIDDLQDVLDFVADTTLGPLVKLLVYNVDALNGLLELIDPSTPGEWIEDERTETGGGLLAEVANWCAEHGHMELFRRIAELLWGRAQPPSPLAAISFAMMDAHNYAVASRKCKPWGDSLEVFFDAGSVNLVTFVDRLLQRVRAQENGWLNGQRAAFAGYVSFRFTGQSIGLLAMQKFPITCSIEIAAPGAVKGTKPFLELTELDAIALGARVHWGQRNSLTMPMVEGMYDTVSSSGWLFRWRQVLSRLSANGRLARFSTDFTRDRGLEVVQPKIHAFQPSRALTCAGSTVHVYWDALDNPPASPQSPQGTTARLELRKQWSLGPHTSIDLGSLHASRDVVVPHGRYELVLIVNYTLNNVPRNETRSFTVRALQDHEIVQVAPVAKCIVVDGVQRWSAKFVFDNSCSPQLAVEELTCELVGASAWFARREGGTVSVALTPSAKTVPLPSRPRLQGTWTFFVDAPGCGAPAPMVFVDFKVVCTPT